MDLGLTEQQAPLGDNLAKFLSDRYGFQTRRKVLAGELGWRPPTTAMG